MSDTRGSLPNTTMGLLLMGKVRDLDQGAEGPSNVGNRDKQVDTIKMTDPVGLMVCSSWIEDEMSPESNALTRRVAHP